MAPWQKLLLGLMVTAMALTAVLTWGSLGSAVMVMGLILTASVLLWRKFLLKDEDDYYE